MTTPLTLPTSFTYSNELTDLRLSPPVRHTAGQGGAGRVVIQDGNFVLPLDQATTAGVRMVRIPTDAIVKEVKFGVDAAGGTLTTLTGTIGLVYSNTALDGTGAVNAANAAPYSCGAFAATTSAGLALAAAAKDVLLDVTFKAQNGVSTFTDGFYVISASTMPIWLAITQGGPAPLTAGAWAGLGATSLSTSPSYQLSQRPAGFFDLYFQPTTTSNLSAAMNALCRVTYVTT